MPRVEIGDMVRLYGFPGLFLVSSGVRQGAVCGVFNAESVKDSRLWFSANESSVVERNGRPVPCLSAPVAFPAVDYPHEPQFDYTDGPASLGESAVEWWKANHKAA
jgi:hypothetical protein